MTRLLLVLFALNLGGCASWIQRFRENPAAVLNETVGYFRTAMSLARGAFELWASSTNAPDVETTRARFNQTMGDVDRGLLVAQDGVRLAATAAGPQPNMEALFTDAKTSMTHLHDFLSNLPSSGPGRAADPTMQAALSATARAAAQPLP